jgi:RNA-splicing ligase RtcB
VIEKEVILLSKYDLKIFAKDVDEEALDQIYTLMKQDSFKDEKVRIMPDVHTGIGTVIGFTSTIGDKIIPNVVGVDIGCGMLTIEIENTNLNLVYIDDIIHMYIPSGFSIHQHAQDLPFPLTDLKVYDELDNVRRLENSLGTLGGGNHFIEIGRNDEGRTFLIIHSGSRNLGYQIANIYQKKAVKHVNEKRKNRHNEIINKLIKENRHNEIESTLNELHKEPKIPNDLAYLENEDRLNYLHDMKLCQIFASKNREKIADVILEKCNLKEISRFETIHNYIGDDNIVRKGAIEAYKGKPVLVPINMRDGSIYGIGLGNPDWNYSGPHGAGRILSRNEAKRILLMDDLKKDMKDVFTTTLSKDTLDESPRVYKPIYEIIEQIKDTIDVKFIIKPIYNFKG